MALWDNNKRRKEQNPAIDFNGVEKKRQRIRKKGYKGEENTVFIP